MYTSIKGLEIVSEARVAYAFVRCVISQLLKKIIKKSNIQKTGIGSIYASQEKRW